MKTRVIKYVYPNPNDAIQLSGDLVEPAYKMYKMVDFKVVPFPGMLIALDGETELVYAAGHVLSGSSGILEEGTPQLEILVRSELTAENENAHKIYRGLKEKGWKDLEGSNIDFLSWIDGPEVYVDGELEDGPSSNTDVSGYDGWLDPPSMS